MKIAKCDECYGSSLSAVCIDEKIHAPWLDDFIVNYKTVVPL
jgi:hypothetical protein